MKPSFHFLYILLFAVNARAVTVMLTMSGRISETDAANFFPTPPVAAGDQWSATMTWHHPTPGFQIIEISYNDPLGSVQFAVNGHSWEAPHLLGGLGGTSFNANLAGITAAPAMLTTPGSYSSVQFIWRGLVVADTDISSLPQSFSDWNLPAAQAFEMEVRTGIDQPAGVWLIKANSYDTMTIQVIPEPGTSALAGVAMLAVLSRRRKVGI
jgi:hypothetical protein